LLQTDGSISTYRVEATTGHLEFTLRQEIGDAHAMVGDPAGRYVYVAYGPRDRAASHRQDASIVLHEADVSGRLVALSEGSSRPWGANVFGTDCWGDGWTWLSAGSGRVWGLWESRFAFQCHHDSYTGVSHAVTTGGNLEAGVIGDIWEDWGAATLDPEADVLYKSRYYTPGALTSHVVGPDGRLKSMGTTSLCVATEVLSVQPLVAVRGFVFGSIDAFGPDDAAVCSWEGPRLAPRANLGFEGSTAAAFSPRDATSPARLAIADDVLGPTPRYVYRRTDLRLLSLGGGGDVVLLDTVELPRRVWQLLFDPSGRFLYVADELGTLRSYDVSSGTRLAPIESVPGAARPARPRDSSSQRPFMAIAVPKVRQP
jgi:hypothetical protein